VKIQELTQKIYQEGVEKAKQEEKTILEKARKEAEDMVAAARSESARIVQEAEQAAKDSRNKLTAEIELAAQQGLSLLRQKVSDLLVDSTLKPAVAAAMDDKNFVESLIRAVVEKWDTGQTSLDLSLVLPESDQKRFEDFFKSKAKDLLDKGLEVKFAARMSGGFVVGPKDSSYKLSFDEADFVEFFKSFLRQRTKEILFPGKNA
jgi:V/A-type H+-transporting ATPase subunit E